MAERIGTQPTNINSPGRNFSTLEKQTVGGSSLGDTNQDSDLVKVVAQVNREVAAQKFTVERKKRFLAHLRKMDWEQEQGTSDETWDTFFEIIGEMLKSKDVDSLVAPTLEVLTDVFAALPHLVNLIDDGSIEEFDLGRLLEGEHFSVFTDFVFAVQIGSRSEHKAKIADLEEKNV